MKKLQYFLFFYFVCDFVSVFFFVIVLSDKKGILNLSKLGPKANHRLYPTLG